MFRLDKWTLTNYWPNSFSYISPTKKLNMFQSFLVHSHQSVDGRLYYMMWFKRLFPNLVVSQFCIGEIVKTPVPASWPDLVRDSYFNSSYFSSRRVNLVFLSKLNNIHCTVGKNYCELLMSRKLKRRDVWRGCDDLGCAFDQT